MILSRHSVLSSHLPKQYILVGQCRSVPTPGGDKRGEVAVLFTDGDTMVSVPGIEYGFLFAKISLDGMVTGYGGSLWWHGYLAVESQWFFVVFRSS